MYRRKIESVLAEWKDVPNHKPLVIKGVRQCGKTSSVLDFAKKNYENVVYLDFHRQEELIELFSGSLETDYLTMVISASLPGARFVPGKTCLIFDEIQNCPRARSSLKFFKIDGRYDVICYKGECTPLECKARTGNAKSMKTLLKHPEKYHFYHALKVGDYNIGRSNQLLTLPFYMAFLLTEI